MSTISYYARGDSQTANNNSLNVSNTNQVEATLLTFESFSLSGDAGDLSFDLNGGDPDPDTRVYVGDESEPISFIVEFRGNLPNNGRLAAVGDPPDTVDLRGAEITVITLQTGERLFLVTDERPEFDGIFSFDPDLGEGGDALNIMDDFPSGAFQIDNLVVCFAAGTLIQTPSGHKPVESLKVGDQVVTETGAATIRLVSHRKVTAEEMCDNARLRPVVIPAGALGPGMPTSNLTLTGTHRIKVTDPGLEWMFGVNQAFVQARDVPNARPGPIVDTTLVHFLCDEHVVVDANGCPSESLFPGDLALMALTPRERAAYGLLADCRHVKTAYPCLTGQEASVWRKSVQSRENLTDWVGVHDTSISTPASDSTSAVTTPCS